MGPVSIQQSTSTTALVVSTANGPFQVKDVQLKEMLADEILVKIVATGVCHADIATVAVRYVFSIKKLWLKTCIGGDRSIITSNPGP